MSVVTKNPFAYLGNDSDGEEKPVVPVKTVDKNTARTTKRNVEPQAPVRAAGAGGNRRGAGGNEGAFQDRGAGARRNQGRSTEETPRDGARGGAGARVRGGRGARRAHERDDRHTSKFGGHGGSDKQAAQSWGANEGQAELKDEQAGEAIAKDEQKDAAAEEAAAAEAAAEEEAEKQVSYEDYLAQQAEKKAALESGPKVREANEGSKLDKKWANAKAIAKEDEEDFVAGTGGKAKRERQRTQKQVVEIDQRYVEPTERAGGRGGFRGGRGRGDGPPRGDRGGFRGRGEGQRGRARGDRGPPRQSAPRNGGASASIQIEDQSAFPSLGA